MHRMEDVAVLPRTFLQKRGQRLEDYLKKAIPPKNRARLG